jgi:hypothetical protein
MSIFLGDLDGVVGLDAEIAKLCSIFACPTGAAANIRGCRMPDAGGSVITIADLARRTFRPDSPGAAMSPQQAAPHVERPPLKLRDCYWFFGPLVLMVELNMMSKSVIHAFLARTDNPSAALAAFNAAFTFYFAITAASEVTTVLCLSFLKARARMDPVLCSRDCRQHMASAQAGVVRGKVIGRRDHGLCGRMCPLHSRCSDKTGIHEFMRL